MPDAPLELRDLVKHYGAVVAVGGVSFRINQGEVFGLLGPNGAGKTTIISIITTLEGATGGGAYVFGRDVAYGHPQTKLVLGVTPQELVSHGFFTVEEVLRFQSGYYGLARNESHIAFLLERLGLRENANKKIRQLSGGMKRRFMIAKALVHRPKLLLLDEPTAGVDVELRATLWEFVRELNQEGMSILLTTHYLEEAESLCHRVGILHRGKLLCVEKTRDLVKQLTTKEITLITKRPAPATVVHGQLVSQGDGELVFRVPHDKTLGELLKEIELDGEMLKDVRVREGKLEDAFLHLVHHEPSGRD